MIDTRCTHAFVPAEKPGWDNVCMRPEPDQDNEPCGWPREDHVTPSKVQVIEARAAKAYESDNPDRDKVQAWFNALPDVDLGVLWGIACTQGASWDDEVFEALDQRGWFES
jgi:hypothetical protein